MLFRSLRERASVHDPSGKREKARHPFGRRAYRKSYRRFLHDLFREAGTSIIFTAILIGALTLLFDKNLASILKFLWFCVCKVCGWIVALFRAITAKKLQEELDDEEEAEPPKRIKPEEVEVSLPQPKFTPKPAPKKPTPPPEPEEKPVPMIMTADESDLPPYELPDVELLDMPDSTDMRELEGEAKAKAKILADVFRQ